MQLALFALWRRQHAAIVKTTTLAICLMVSSVALGFILAQARVIQMGEFACSHDVFGNKNTACVAIETMPTLAMANPEPISLLDDEGEFPGARRIGELQAEVLRLRLLFSRIAEAAELDGSEFELAVQLADQRYLNSLQVLEKSPETSNERFELAASAVDHMADKAQLMLGISQQRQHERDFSLSGSPVARARITSRFGYRIDPLSGRRQFHRGLDFGGRPGSKVFALADGVVTYSGRNGGYGNLVELEHAEGYLTRYAHNKLNLVSVGERIEKGQAIATMGSTGRSTGTHVHVEVRHEGRAIDPLQFITAGS